jgi:hypothetical protein
MPETPKRIFKRFTEKPYKGVEGSYALMVGDSCKFVAMKGVSSGTRYEAPTAVNTKQLYKGEPIEKDLTMQEYVNLLAVKAKAAV